MCRVKPGQWGFALSAARFNPEKARSSGASGHALLHAKTLERFTQGVASITHQFQLCSCRDDAYLELVAGTALNRFRCCARSRNNDGCGLDPTGRVELPKCAFKLIGVECDRHGWILNCAGFLTGRAACGAACLSAEEHGLVHKQAML